MSDFLGEDVREAFLKRPPEYLVSDDLDWLDDLVWQARGIRVDSKYELTERLLGRVRAIRACHGTSAPSVKPFYEHGLRPLEIEEFHERARQIFLSGDFPELTEAHMRRALEYLVPAARKGRVSFEANERFLKERCGHHMLYGSAYLTSIAANFGGARDYRSILKGRFAPILFVCDVPLTSLHPCTVAELAGTALASIFQELLEGSSYAPDKWRALGFGIRV